MKAIGIKMVELQPMTAREANDKGHRIGNHSFEEEGYEVTYPDGYKSWSPKDVADAAYYLLSENNDGTKIIKEDVENFITNVDVTTIGEKTTVVNAHTRSGFDMVRHSSCVDPKNYSEELGKQYAMEEVVNSLWSHLGFVLQWAKYGLNAESKKDKYPSHVQRMIDEYKELDDRINKLASFINTNPIFETLQNEEREDMKAQLIWMHKYINVLANRLRRQNVEPSKLLDK
jgi:hypothetical protein